MRDVDDDDDSSGGKDQALALFYLAKDLCVLILHLFFTLLSFFPWLLEEDLVWMPPPTPSTKTVKMS